jgi:hypothetical protein
MLSAARPGVRWEVVNTAVPGYNTVQEVETLAARFLGYVPDLVIVDYVGNDLTLPGFLKAPAPYLTTHKSFLWEFVRFRLQGISTSQDWRLRNATGVPIGEAAFAERLEEDTLRAVAPEYRDMVGLGAYREAMAKLSRLSRQHGFEVLVFTTLHMDAPVQGVCEALGLPVIENGERINQYMREQGIGSYRGSPMTVEDGHPSAITHRLNAETLFGILSERLGADDQMAGSGR